MLTQEGESITYVNLGWEDFLSLRIETLILKEADLRIDSLNIDLIFFSLGICQQAGTQVTFTFDLLAVSFSFTFGLGRFFK